MARRSRGFSRGNRPRRQRSWEEGPGNGSSITADITTSGSTIVGAGAAALQDDLTIARLRGELLYFIDSVAATEDGFHGAFGIGVVEANAFAVGVTAVPTPITDQDWDGWMYWSPLWAIGVADAEALSVNTVSAASRKEVDTKAMRKLRLNDVVYAVVEVTEAAGTSILHVGFDSRILVLLP